MASVPKDPLQYGGPGATPNARPLGSAAGAGLPADYLLIARPHLQLSGDTLRSRGVPDCSRQLSSSEMQLWQLMQRPIRVQEARQLFGGGADLLMRSFLRDGVCLLLESDFPANRRRVLVVEPHADDAVLSVGGTMWLRRRECAFVIATMASRSNHTRYRDLGVNHDTNTVTELRRREAELAAQMVGGQHVSVGMTDAALRYHDAEWTEEFYRRHHLSIDASNSRIAGESELRRWQDALLRLIGEQHPAEIWFPLGGPHADHMLTADACLATFVAHPALLQDRILRIYQEVPYAVRYPHHMSVVLAAIKQAGVVLEQEVTSIAQVRAEKRRLASLYDSQEMEELFTAGGDLPESLWRVQALPRQLPAAGIASQVIAGQEPGASAVAEWVARNRNASYVRVLLMTASGRWQNDLNMLSAMFPRARFEVCSAISATAEVAEVPSDLVDRRAVAGGTRAWLLESLRLCLAQPAPTLVQAAAPRVGQARLLSKLWLGSDALVISSMDQLANAPRIARGD